MVIVRVKFKDVVIVLDIFKVMVMVMNIENNIHL